MLNFAKLITIVLLALCWRLSSSRQCASQDFTYEYTQCDQNGQRWRVALPKNHNDQCENVPVPKNGVNCSYSCPAGNYLNMESQECQPCPAGSYSLGDGVRYSEFENLPDGFFVESFVDDSNQIYGQSVSHSCPKNSGWSVLDGEIRYTPTSCVSRLSISLHLIKDGFVEIFYQLPKSRHSLISELTIRNEQCESYGTQSIFKRRRLVDDDVSTGNDWNLKRFNVRRGQNLLVWTVASSDLTTLADVIRISRVDIVGLAFTPKCTLCPAGSYSGKGSAQCFGCQAGFYSKKGATSCTLCNINEYSGPKAGQCRVKPICQDLDYYPSYGKCNINHISKSFKKIEPQICISSSNPPEVTETCQKCDAGYHRDSAGSCAPCSSSEFSDGVQCTKCPNSTIPEYGIFFTNWEKMPEVMGSACEYIMAEELGECPVPTAWIPRGNRIETASTRNLGVALELSLNITYGFFDPLRSPSSKVSSDDPIARFDLDFEMDCADDSCQLYIVLVDLDTKKSRKNGFRFLDLFNGRMKRQVRSYAIIENSPVKLILAFMRSKASNGQDVIDDNAVVYALNITNVADKSGKGNLGGARRCKPCPTNSGSKGECKPCPAGHFIKEKTNECMKCPEGTALNSTSNKVGVESCVKCPPHMGSISRTECGFTGVVNLNIDDKEMKFDLTPLKEHLFSASGIKIFPREGSPYYHAFNATIFDDDILCHDTYDSNLIDSVYVPLSNNVQGSRSKFCRATAIPTPKSITANSSKETASYVSSYVISSKLASITQDRKYNGFEISDKQLEYDLSAKSSTKPIDIHFFFEPTSTKTATCPNGTIGVVTTRCEPLAVTNPEVRLSRSCPDGTCDGCMFHIIVESSFACPICEPKDFDEIKGECVDGKQKIHSIPSKHCVLTGMQTRERTELCSSMDSNIKFLFFLASILIVFLVTIIFIIHRRNKRLEYRYSRIVEGKEPDDVNSCGLESDESDEEEDNKTKVFFNRNKQNNEESVRVGNKAPGKKEALLDSEIQDFLSDSS